MGQTTSRLREYQPSSANEPTSARLLDARWPADVVALTVLVVAGTALARHYLLHGWVPHDEGALAQSAERVLNGQLPHRDFDDIYTGGLALMDALAFRLLGTSLVTLRIVLLAWFVAWLPAVYYIARRFMPPFAAIAVGYLAAAWSIPTYSAAIPSWYNLFLGTFCVAAMLRYVDSGRRRWLVLAGVFTGLSILMKIVGLYLAIGVCLSLLYVEQERCRSQESAGEGSGAYRWAIAVGLALLVAAELSLLRGRVSPSRVVHFVVPTAAIAVFLIWRERRVGSGRSADRLRRLVGLAAPYAIGVIIPVVLFLLPYAASGALGAVVEGVLVLPRRRLAYAAMSPVSISKSLEYGIPIWLVVLVPLSKAWQRRALAAGLAVALAIVLYLDLPARTSVYVPISLSLRAMVPLTTIVALVFLANVPAARRSPHVDAALFTLVSVTALSSLVQFPFSAPIYFFYIAPLALLTMAAIVATYRRGSWGVGLVILAFYIAFTVRYIEPGFIYTLGWNFARDGQTEKQTGPRGGLSVSIESRTEYDSLTATIRAHLRGSYSYAGPDCPQVYFLSGTRNPTRTLFDFFDDPIGRTERILGQLRAADVNVVTINTEPSFSKPMPRDLERALVQEYPHSVPIGHFFVRWRR